MTNFQEMQLELLNDYIVSLDCRDYLRKYRNPAQIPLILDQVMKGLVSLHGLGYVHRDLKPENIVLNLDPLEVRIIEFKQLFQLVIEALILKGVASVTSQTNINGGQDP